MSAIFKTFKYVSLHQKPFNILRLTLCNIKSLHKTVTYYLSHSKYLQKTYQYSDIGKPAVLPAIPFTRDHTRNLNLGQLMRDASNATASLNSCKYTRFSFSNPET